MYIIIMDTLLHMGTLPMEMWDIISSSLSSSTDSFDGYYITFLMQFNNTVVRKICNWFWENQSSGKFSQNRCPNIQNLFLTRTSSH